MLGFDPKIVVTAAAGRLRERPPLVVAGSDESDVLTQRLLYRGVKAYAVGHGCAVYWHSGDDGSVTSLATTFVPRHELLLSDPGGGDGVDLSMDALGLAEDFSVLDALVAGYETWIDGLSEPSTTLTSEQMATLDRHVLEAREAAQRMRTGIDLLRTDAAVRQAFQLMNQAMSEQRRRQEHHRSGGLGDPPIDASPGMWRPFQMAFILVNLCGLADPEHRDRQIADLLGSPPGGKTEAYLGIIGVAIMLRRIRSPRAGGVSVLMRYTLRLLTLQQYQRAAGLVCALEMLRQRELPESKVVSIGLWGRASLDSEQRR